MTEFTERYKSLSNFELWEILAEAKNYQPLAVETAKKEIESRNLSEEEINRVKLEVESKQLEKQKLIKNRKQKEDKIKSAVATFLDTINPIQTTGIQTPEKTIRLIVIVFTGIFFMSLGRQPLGNPTLEVIFPTASPITYLFSLFIYVGTLWVISKEGIREIYFLRKEN